MDLEVLIHKVLLDIWRRAQRVCPWGSRKWHIVRAGHAVRRSITDHMVLHERIACRPCSADGTVSAYCRVLMEDSRVTYMGCTKPYPRRNSHHEKDYRR